MHVQCTLVLEPENTKSGVFSCIQYVFKKKTLLLSDFWTCLPKVGHIVNLLYKTN